MSNNDMLGKLVKLIVGLPVETVVWLTSLKRFLRKENVWVQPLFKHDKTKDGWTLLEDAPFNGGCFIPEFVGFLKSGESYINGKEMRRRAVELNANRGQRDAEWLLENQGGIPRELRGKFLVFPGTVWFTSDGIHYVPCLDWRGDKWCWGFYWLGSVWGDSLRLVGSRE